MAKKKLELEVTQEPMTNKVDGKVTINSKLNDNSIIVTDKFTLDKALQESSSGIVEGINQTVGTKISKIEEDVRTLKGEVGGIDGKVTAAVNGALDGVNKRIDTVSSNLEKSHKNLAGQISNVKEELQGNIRDAVTTGCNKILTTVTEGYKSEDARLYKYIKKNAGDIDELRTLQGQESAKVAESIKKAKEEAIAASNLYTDGEITKSEGKITKAYQKEISDTKTTLEGYIEQGITAAYKQAQVGVNEAIANAKIECKSYTDSEVKEVTSEVFKVKKNVKVNTEEIANLKKQVAGVNNTIQSEIGLAKEELKKDTTEKVNAALKGVDEKIQAAVEGVAGTMDATIEDKVNKITKPVVDSIDQKVNTAKTEAIQEARKYTDKVVVDLTTTVEDNKADTDRKINSLTNIVNTNTDSINALKQKADNLEASISSSEANAIKTAVDTANKNIQTAYEASKSNTSKELGKQEQKITEAYKQADKVLSETLSDLMDVKDAAIEAKINNNITGLINTAKNEAIETAKELDTVINNGLSSLEKRVTTIENGRDDTANAINNAVAKVKNECKTYTDDTCAEFKQSAIDNSKIYTNQKFQEALREASKDAAKKDADLKALLTKEIVRIEGSITDSAGNVTNAAIAAVKLELTKAFQGADEALDKKFTEMIPAAAGQAKEDAIQAAKEYTDGEITKAKEAAAAEAARLDGELHTTITGETTEAIQAAKEDIISMLPNTEEFASAVKYLADANYTTTNKYFDYTNRSFKSPTSSLTGSWTQHANLSVTDGNGMIKISCTNPEGVNHSMFPSVDLTKLNPEYANGLTVSVDFKYNKNELPVYRAWPGIFCITDGEGTAIANKCLSIGGSDLKTSSKLVLNTQVDNAASDQGVTWNTNIAVQTEFSGKIIATIAADKVVIYVYNYANGTTVKSERTFGSKRLNLQKAKKLILGAAICYNDLDNVFYFNNVIVIPKVLTQAEVEDMCKSIGTTVDPTGIVIANNTDRITALESKTTSDISGLREELQDFATGKANDAEGNAIKASKNYTDTQIGNLTGTLTGNYEAAIKDAMQKLHTDYNQMDKNLHDVIKGEIKTAKEEAIAGGKAEAEKLDQAIKGDLTALTERVVVNETAIGNVPGQIETAKGQAITAANEYTDGEITKAKKEAVGAAKEYTDAEIIKAKGAAATEAGRLDGILHETITGETTEAINNAKEEIKAMLPNSEEFAGAVDMIKQSSYITTGEYFNYTGRTFTSPISSLNGSWVQKDNLAVSNFENMIKINVTNSANLTQSDFPSVDLSSLTSTFNNGFTISVDFRYKKSELGTGHTWSGLFCLTDGAGIDIGNKIISVGADDLKQQTNLSINSQLQNGLNAGNNTWNTGVRVTDEFYGKIILTFNASSISYYVYNYADKRLTKFDRSFTGGTIALNRIKRLILGSAIAYSDFVITAYFDNVVIVPKKMEQPEVEKLCKSFNKTIDSTSLVIAGNGNEITKLDTRVDGLEQRVTTAEGTITQHTSSINDIKEQIRLNNQADTELKAQVEANKQSIAGNTSKIAANAEAIEGINRDLATKANDADVVKIAGDQNITGIKTATAGMKVNTVLEDPKAVVNKETLESVAGEKAGEALKQAKSYADGKATEAINTAKGYTDEEVKKAKKALFDDYTGKIGTLQTSLGEDIKTAKGDAITEAVRQATELDNAVKQGLNDRIDLEIGNLRRDMEDGASPTTDCIVTTTDLVETGQVFTIEDTIDVTNRVWKDTLNNLKFTWPNQANLSITKDGDFLKLLCSNTQGVQQDQFPVIDVSSVSGKFQGCLLLYVDFKFKKSEQPADLDYSGIISLTDGGGFYSSNKIISFGAARLKTGRTFNINTQLQDGASTTTNNGFDTTFAVEDEFAGRLIIKAKPNVCTFYVFENKTQTLKKYERPVSTGAIATNHIRKIVLGTSINYGNVNNCYYFNNLYIGNKDMTDEEVLTLCKSIKGKVFPVAVELGKTNSKLSGVATDGTVVKVTGDQTVGGKKTFTNETTIFMNVNATASYRTNGIVMGPINMSSDGGFYSICKGDQSARLAWFGYNNEGDRNFTFTNEKGGIFNFNKGIVITDNSYTPNGNNDVVTVKYVKDNFALKTDLSGYVKTTTNQEVAGTKTFTDTIIGKDLQLGKGLDPQRTAVSIVPDAGVKKLTFGWDNNRRFDLDLKGFTDVYGVKTVTADNGHNSYVVNVQMLNTVKDAILSTKASNQSLGLIKTGTAIGNIVVDNTGVASVKGFTELKEQMDTINGNVVLKNAQAEQAITNNLKLTDGKLSVNGGGNALTLQHDGLNYIEFKLANGDSAGKIGFANNANANEIQFTATNPDAYFIFDKKVKGVDATANDEFVTLQQHNTKANDADVVKLTGDQSVRGIKTFVDTPVISNIKLGYGVSSDRAVFIIPDQGNKTLTFGWDNGNKFDLNLNEKSDLKGIKTVTLSTANNKYAVNVEMLNTVKNNILGTVATDSRLGLVKSSTVEGNVKVAGDGVQTVVGFADLKQRVDTLTAGGNVDLSNVVMKNAEGVQNITNGLQIGGPVTLTGGNAALVLQSNGANFVEVKAADGTRVGYFGFGSGAGNKLNKEIVFSISDRDGWFYFDKIVAGIDGRDPGHFVTKRQLDTKANDADVVKLTGDQNNIQGVKTFRSNIITSNLVLGYGISSDIAVCIKPDQGNKTIAFGTAAGNKFDIDLKGWSELKGVKTVDTDAAHNTYAVNVEMVNNVKTSILGNVVKLTGNQDNIQGIKTFRDGVITGNLKLGYGVQSSTAVTILPDDGTKTLAFGVSNSSKFILDLKGYSDLKGLKTVTLSEGNNSFAVNVQMLNTGLTNLGNTVVKLTGDQTVDGTKTFNTFPRIGDKFRPTDQCQLVNKDYVDNCANLPEKIVIPDLEYVFGDDIVIPAEGPYNEENTFWRAKDQLDAFKLVPHSRPCHADANPSIGVPGTVLEKQADCLVIANKKQPPSNVANSGGGNNIWCIDVRDLFRKNKVNACSYTANIMFSRDNDCFTQGPGGFWSVIGFGDQGGASGGQQVRGFGLIYVCRDINRDGILSKIDIGGRLSNEFRIPVDRYINLAVTYENSEFIVYVDDVEVLRQASNNQGPINDDVRNITRFWIFPDPENNMGGCNWNSTSSGCLKIKNIRVNLESYVPGCYSDIDTIDIPEWSRTLYKRTIENKQSIRGTDARISGLEHRYATRKFVGIAIEDFGIVSEKYVPTRYRYEYGPNLVVAASDWNTTNTYWDPEGTVGDSSPARLTLAPGPRTDQGTGGTNPYGADLILKKTNEGLKLGNLNLLTGCNMWKANLGDIFNGAPGLCFQAHMKFYNNPDYLGPIQNWMPVIGLGNDGEGGPNQTSSVKGFGMLYTTGRVDSDGIECCIDLDNKLSEPFRVPVDEFVTVTVGYSNTTGNFQVYVNDRLRLEAPKNTSSPFVNETRNVTRLWIMPDPNEHIKTTVGTPPNYNHNVCGLYEFKKIYIACDSYEPRCFYTLDNVPIPEWTRNIYKKDKHQDEALQHHEDKLVQLEDQTNQIEVLKDQMFGLYDLVQVPRSNKVIMNLGPSKDFAHGVVTNGIVPKSTIPTIPLFKGGQNVTTFGTKNEVTGNGGFGYSSTDNFFYIGRSVTGSGWKLPEGFTLSSTEGFTIETEFQILSNKVADWCGLFVFTGAADLPGVGNVTHRTGPNFRVEVDSNSNLRCYRDNASGNGPMGNVSIDYGPASNGSIFKLVFTVDSSNMKFYKDYTSKGTVALSGELQISKIGLQYGGFDYKITKFRIWKGAALTQEEITALGNL